MNCRVFLEAILIVQHWVYIVLKFPCIGIEERTVCSNKTQMQVEKLIVSLKWK